MVSLSQIDGYIWLLTHLGATTEQAAWLLEITPIEVELALSRAAEPDHCDEGTTDVKDWQPRSAIAGR